MADPFVGGCEVEYLNTNGARDDSTNRAMVAITIRPDPKHTWRSINLVITKSSAKRLIADLKRSLRSPLCRD